MQLAPVVLFVYNRPEHTKKTLQALSGNMLADQTTLYVFADGPKINASKEELNRIDQTRAVLKQKKWCSEVFIQENDSNLGLANSVVKGVSSILNKFDCAIILEDDILTHPYFLSFMNGGLELYKSEQQVYGVSGYQFPHNGKIKPSTYFLPVMSSWGYGTWSDRWNKINFNGNDLLKQVEQRQLIPNMRFGSFDFYQMLKDQVSGKNDSWAVRFYTSMLLDDGVFLYPRETLLQNIGFDGSGVHCEYDEERQATTDVRSSRVNFVLQKQEIRLNPKIVKLFRVDTQRGNSTLKLKKKLKNGIKKLLAPELMQLLKRKVATAEKDPYGSLKNFPRYTETKATLLGKAIIIPDAASFLFMHKEIFEQEIYKFKASVKTPYIVDAGANIGLATIYFKHVFPNAEIVAFEPDQEIFRILKHNLESFDAKDVQLVKKGLWNEERQIGFMSEGADGGLISNSQILGNTIINVVSLKGYLYKKVDFLKMDIEGAETVVLQNIESKLYFVDRIFIEYHSFVGEAQTLDVIINILTKAGFRLHINAPGLSSKQPFIARSEYNNMDMQLNIYAFKDF